MATVGGFELGQEVVLFHSVLGLRPAVGAFADQLRAAGHTVHTPDLFDGEVFDSLEDGARKRDATGIGELMRRARAAVANLPAEIVVAGFSMAPARLSSWPRPDREQGPRF
jgi:dienelactone hydrolase